MAETFDFVIVGAGIAGASLAATLAAHGRVLLLEREPRPGVHATGRSAAMFHQSYGGPKLQPLSTASLELFAGLDPGFWPRPVLSPRGILMVADSSCEAAFDRHVAEAGGSLEPITVVEATRLFGLLRPERITDAAYDAGGQDIDVDLLHQGYLRQFAARGGTLLCGSAPAIIGRDRDDWALTVAERTIAAPVLIDAAGAWGDELAEQARAPMIGLQPKLRTAALIDAPPGIDGWPMVIDAAESFYVKPDAGRLLLSPADETDVPPHDAAADDLALAEGAERMTHYLDWDIRRKPQAWAGLRTFSPDRVPVIGWAPDTPGFFWLVGQGGYGVQTAPAAAQLAAALLLDASDLVPPGVQPATYDPARFSR